MLWLLLHLLGDQMGLVDLQLLEEDLDSSFGLENTEFLKSEKVLYHIITD